MQLRERVKKGRIAINLARSRRLDTSALEQHLAGLVKLEGLITWSSELIDQDLVLSHPVSYAEAPRSTVTTGRVSWYAARYLETIVSARHYQQHPGLCWGQWAPKWWWERGVEAIASLEELQRAVERRRMDGT
ncbi:MAG: hypothetical protein QGI09_07655 [Dehalococcoidia bacterium]|nr:hypothetical protein [Dehalococcoidia bacterium]